jgi:hypothetical protein
MQLTEIETSQKCFHCNKAQATYKASIKVGGVIVCPILCNVCSNLPDVVIFQGIIGENKNVESD